MAALAWKPRREFIAELIGMGRRLTTRPIWLAIVAKSEAESWLAQFADPE